MILRELDRSDISEIFRSRIPADFPPAEIKPDDIVRALLDKGHYTGYGYYDGEMPAAYAVFVDTGDSLLLDYYATDPGLRGKGTGSAFFKELSGMFSGQNSFLIEVEDPDTAADEDDLKTRTRRIDFYLRNGARMTGVKSRIAGVDYRIMTGSDMQHTDDEIREIYRKIYMLLAGMRKRTDSAQTVFEKNIFEIK